MHDNNSPLRNKYAAKGKTISSNHGPSSFHLSELLRFSSSIKPVKAVSALIMRSTSQSSILNSVNKPCFSSASFFSGCEFSFGITIAPFLSFIKPPPDKETGEPDSVPTAKIDKRF